MADIKSLFITPTQSVSGTFNSTTNVSGVKVFNTTAKTLTVYHDYGVWKPAAIAFYDADGKYQPIYPDSITPGNGSIVVDFTSAYDAGDITASDWNYNFGNAVAAEATTFTGLSDTPSSLSGEGGKFVAVNTGGTALEFVEAPSGGGATVLAAVTAESMPLGFNETFWSVSARPAYDASITGTGVLRFDYSTAEYAGQVTLLAIPSGATNLVTKIKARPFSTAASGTNMGWGIKYIIIRDNTATTSVATQVLGSTAFNGTGAGDTTGTYTVALSTLSATAGDTIVLLLYANTGVSSPKQTDWMLINAEWSIS